MTKTHPEDALLAAEIAKATEFSACLHLGPGNRHTVRGIKTYAAALDRARELNELSKFGRRTIIYAISPLGSFPVDDRLARMAGLVA